RGEGGANAIAVTRDGKHAVVLQGSTYVSRGLIRLDLRRSPAKITGINRKIKGRGLDHVVVRGNRFAYATSGHQLVVSRINRRRPKIIKRIKFSKRLTQLAITPNGRWLYVAREVGWDDARIFVYRIKKNGIPRRRHVMKRRTVTGLGVTPNGNRLIIGANHRLRVFTLRHPSRPKKQGKAVKVGLSDPNALAFSRNSRFVYAMADGEITVVRVNLRKRKQVRRKVLRRYDFGGDIALSRNGKRLMVLNGHAGYETPSIYLLNRRLKVKKAFSGACYPEAAAASWHGPTRRRFYVADSGVCDKRVQFTPLRPS
ncbi:MAG: hypothetical protein L0K86_10590, partial [Actinomycetia bacterium]|nr:hypothetical protein [Actinomycetes bacterium]